MKIGDKVSFKFGQHVGTGVVRELYANGYGVEIDATLDGEYEAGDILYMLALEVAPYILERREVKRKIELASAPDEVYKLDYELRATSEFNTTAIRLSRDELRQIMEAAQKILG